MDISFKTIRQTKNSTKRKFINAVCMHKKYPKQKFIFELKIMRTFINQQAFFFKCSFIAQWKEKYEQAQQRHLDYETNL